MKTESSKWGLMQLLLKKLTPSKHSLKDLAFLKYIGSSFLINFIRFTYRRTIKKILISGSWDFPMCTAHCCSHGKILILTKILTNMLGEAFLKKKYIFKWYMLIYTPTENIRTSVCGLITENLGLNIVIYFLRVEEDVQ